MDRRRFLLSGAALSATVMLPRVGPAAEVAFAPTPGAWRSFELTTRIEIAKPRGVSQAWLPVPSLDAPDWMRPTGNQWQGNTASAEIYQEPRYGGQLLHAVWADGEPAPVVELTSRFSTRDRAVDLTRRSPTPLKLSAAERALYTSPTRLIPTDGVVRDTASYVTAGVYTDVGKARAIYDWIVDNTFRDPKTRGCGNGDITFLLDHGLGGKCADLNALFVGLARASGLPARDIYGLRVAPSRFGYKALGAGSATVTKAQHCRAEVHLDRFGWVPVDPADVRKVVLEEPPGNLAVDDPKVVAARRTLFGAWETNWVAFNTTHDWVLPGAKEPDLDFLMYPQVETGGERLDSLDPDAVKYTITAKELAAA